MTKHDSNKCDICGEFEALILMRDDKSGTDTNYCQTCFNEMMFAGMGLEAPENVPEELMLVDQAGRVHRFRIEYLNWGNMQRLEAFEGREAGYRCAVGAEFDVSFPELWDRLLVKLEKKLNTLYINEEGIWLSDRIVGDVEWSSQDGLNINIDGKLYSWHELSRRVESHEGWQIKIQFAEPTEDLE
jgi:hypothetical protein